MVQEAVRKAATLIDALPYIKAFHGKGVVIKLGGSAQDDPNLLRHIFTDIDLLISVGMRPVVIYGGGKRISTAMQEAGVEANFVHGQRVTDPATMAIASRVLIDEVGADLFALLRESGGQGELLNGRDHGFLRAVKKNLPAYPEVDLGLVGEPVAIDAPLANALLDRGVIPLIAPIACGVGAESRTLYNINGDTAAAQVARDLHATKIVFLSDIPGILSAANNADSERTLLPHLDRVAIEKLIAEEVIAGGMIPKVEACLHALDGGVRKAHIVSGAQPHALLLEIFTSKGIGTEIVEVS